MLKMDSFNTSEKVQVIKWHFQGHSYHKIAKHLWPKAFEFSPPITKKQIGEIVNNFEGSGCIHAYKKPLEKKKDRFTCICYKTEENVQIKFESDESVCSEEENELKHEGVNIKLEIEENEICDIKTEIDYNNRDINENKQIKLETIESVDSEIKSKKKECWNSNIRENNEIISGNVESLSPNIKIEQNDIKCEIKTEKEEYVNSDIKQEYVYLEIKTEPLDYEN